MLYAVGETKIEGRPNEKVPFPLIPQVWPQETYQILPSRLA